MSQDPIYIIEHEAHLELCGISNETELDERIVSSVADNPHLIECVAQRIAHNRAESKMAEDRDGSRRLGDVIASELIEVADVLQKRILGDEQ